MTEGCINTIYGNNAAKIEKYSNKYLKLIEFFYSINKLKLNPDKSRLMVVCRPSRREETRILYWKQAITISNKGTK